MSSVEIERVELKSVGKHVRGFMYSADYEDLTDFKSAMLREQGGHSDICWEHLYNFDGELVASYKRGRGLIDIDQ